MPAMSKTLGLGPTNSPKTLFEIPSSTTPMMAQYWQLKNAHPDCVLFFRMGDFYELFFDDAVKAAPILDVALTRRGQHEGEDVPMCGVPVHAYESYLSRLIKAGLRVAVAEQMEDPAAAKKRGGKTLVERQVIRIMTPGTLTEDAFLEATRSNYLAVLAESAGQLALSWADLSAGQPFVQDVTHDELSATLSRLQPAELVVADTMLAREDMKGALAPYKNILSSLPGARFDRDNAKAVALSYYNVASLDAFGSFTSASATALGAFIDYMRLTQKQDRLNLLPPQATKLDGLLAIDPATRRNLELHEALAGGRKGSLLASIDRTVTGAGARLLADDLAAPLTDLNEIEKRQNRVAFFVNEPALREKIRAALKASPDMPRALTRISLKRGSPRDLQIVRLALEAATAIKFVLNSHGGQADADIKNLAAQLGEHSALIELLAKALKTELPLLARDGGFIAPGYHAALDAYQSLSSDSKRHIATLQGQYSHDTKITTLKIRHNYVIGYHVDVTAAQAEKLMVPPFNATFHHRQTLSGSVRFSTAALAELEGKMAESASRALALELQIFDDLCVHIMQRFDGLRACANALAVLDVSAALADLAHTQKWCRPKIDNSLAFHIEKGRHPVVEEALHKEAQHFTVNDCDLSPEKRLWLVTGPNMAGKSTFLRQNALMVVLAQMGSFVPAAAAHIGIVDRLFSRVGAADDLARGRSTFMVEMIETAAILNQAGARALVILDEIGRGTATFDGLSIAWGSLEYLYHQNKCRGLFATHYHELTALSDHLPHLHCATAKVREWQGEIIFLHEVGQGVAAGSYGLHVARLAGLPAPVLARAATLLYEFEKNRSGNKAAIAPVAAEHFAAPTALPHPTLLEKTLAAIDPDALSPKDALEVMYRLKGMIKG